MSAPYFEKCQEDRLGDQQAGAGERRRGVCAGCVRGVCARCGRGFPLYYQPSQLAMWLTVFIIK